MKSIALFLSTCINALILPALISQDGSILPIPKNRNRQRTLRGNPNTTILSNLASTPSLSKLYTIIQENPILADALAAPDANLTLFAPVNSAIPQILDHDENFF